MTRLLQHLEFELRLVSPEEECVQVVVSDHRHHGEGADDVEERITCGAGPRFGLVGAGHVS